jgi:hypothetical protein
MGGGWQSGFFCPLGGGPLSDDIARRGDDDDDESGQGGRTKRAGAGREGPGAAKEQTTNQPSRRLERARQPANDNPTRRQADDEVFGWWEGVGDVFLLNF